MPHHLYRFPADFCAPTIQICQSAVDEVTSFNLVALSGVGVTFFVNHFRQQIKADIVYVSAYEMHDFTKQALYEQIAKKLGVTHDTPGGMKLDGLAWALRQKLHECERVVLLFHRFDRLKHVVDQNLYDNLRHLRDIDRSKVVMMFVTSEPLTEFSDDSAKSALNLITKTVYFPGYSDHELKQIQATHTPVITVGEGKAIALAGGHHLLLQVLLGCQNLNNPLSDPMVELLIKDIHASLSFRRQRMVEAVALGKEIPADPLLFGTRMVQRSSDGEVRLFSPVMSEYLVRLQAKYLPVKERRLFELLKKHQGELVTKQTIFDVVWREQDGIASDWSLNALVYRLRRHSGFDTQRYAIESRKKEGYMLIDYLRDS